MAFLSGQGREARALAGLHGHESAANRGDLTKRRDPRLPSRALAWTALCSHLVRMVVFQSDNIYTGQSRAKVILASCARSTNGYPLTSITGLRDRERGRPTIREIS